MDTPVNQYAELPAQPVHASEKVQVQSRQLSAGAKKLRIIVSIAFLVLGGWALLASIVASASILEDVEAILGFLLWGAIGIALIVGSLLLRGWERWRFMLGVLFVSVGGLLCFIAFVVPVMLFFESSSTNINVLRLIWFGFIGIALLLIGIRFIRSQK